MVVIFIAWIVFIPLEQKTNLGLIKSMRQWRFLYCCDAFCSTKILGFNQNQKSDKAPFIIQADLKSLIEKIDGYKNNPEKSSSTKSSNHIPSGFFSVHNIAI